MYCLHGRLFLSKSLKRRVLAHLAMATEWFPIGDNETKYVGRSGSRNRPFSRSRTKHFWPLIRQSTVNLLKQRIRHRVPLHLPLPTDIAHFPECNDDLVVEYCSQSYFARFTVNVQNITIYRYVLLSFKNHPQNLRLFSFRKSARDSESRVHYLASQT